MSYEIKTETHPEKGWTVVISPQNTNTIFVTDIENPLLNYLSGLDERSNRNKNKT